MMKTKNPYLKIMRRLQQVYFKFKISINFYKSWCVTLSSQGSGTISEEGTKRFEEPDVGEDKEEIVSSGHDRTTVLTNLTEAVSV